MKLILLEPSKTGFARYCPTFSAAYDRLSTGIRRKAQERRERSEIIGLVKGWKVTPLAETIVNEPAKALLVGGFIFSRERSSTFVSFAALQMASDLGADISAAAPHLVRALEHGEPLVRLKAAETMRDAVAGLCPPGRMEICAGVESFVLRRLDDAVLADPEGSPQLFAALLRLMRSIAAIDGVHPLCIGKLIAELKPRPEAAGSCLGE